jgi:hypothetical protein
VVFRPLEIGVRYFGGRKAMSTLREPMDAAPDLSMERSGSKKTSAPSPVTIARHFVVPEKF